MEEKSILDRLVDPEDKENIVLYDDDDKEMEFEQIAIIPQEDAVYALLHPLDDEIEELGVVVMKVNDEEGAESLEVVDDEEKAQEIYDIYAKMVEEAMNSENK